MDKIFLGVNTDHVATLRQARGTKYPDMVAAVGIVEMAGADSVTIHLREDRRHIQDDDVWQLKETITTKMNLEMAVTKEMINIACEVKPESCCLVPEKREELTTEGGLDIVGQSDKIFDAITQLHEVGIEVSPFIDADKRQIAAAAKAGAKIIEIHTGHYADAVDEISQTRELYKIIQAAQFAEDLGLQVNAGHGLHYLNVKKIASIPQIVELNIGHSIISQALFVGLKSAVEQMKEQMMSARAIEKFSDNI